MTLRLGFFLNKINDRFGHGAANQALQLIAEWLQNQITINRHNYSCKVAKSFIF